MAHDRDPFDWLEEFGQFLVSMLFAYFGGRFIEDALFERRTWLAAILGGVLVLVGFTISRRA